MTYPKDRSFQQYVNSGSWKCDKSPTKAHWWVAEDSEQVCKFCGEARKVSKDGLITFSRPIK